METEMNLYQKIVAVRKSVGDFKKDGKSYDYDYVTGNQVLTKIKDKMNDLNLLLIPSALDGEYEPYTYKTKYGEKTDLIVKGKMTYTWINGDKPEEQMVVPWFYFGQMGEASKAFGSGLTYSERYFLLKSFGIPTDGDDPDAKQEDKEPPKGPKKKAERKVLSEAQVKRLYTLGSLKKLNKNVVDRQVNTKFNKEVSALTREEYDIVCNGYENMKVGE